MLLTIRIIAKSIVTPFRPFASGSAKVRPNDRVDVHHRRPNRNRHDWLGIAGNLVSLTNAEVAVCDAFGESNSILPESEWILATVAVL